MELAEHSALNSAGDEEDLEEYDEGEGYDEQYDEGDDDFAAEAEEMARRLQDQLHADIARAQLEAAAATMNARPEAAAPPPTNDTTQGSNTRKRRHDAAISTMKAILGFAVANSSIHDSLVSLLVPSAGNVNILDVFHRCISSGIVRKSIARPLSEAVVALAKSDVLFASLRNSDAPAIQLDKGKRKRDLMDDGSYDAPAMPPPKRFALDEPDLRSQVSEAVRVVSAAFLPLLNTPTSQPPDPALISSIHPQLHQVFLFAVTSAPRAGERTPPLQELAGLIQMLGVLSGIPIGAPSPHAPWAPPADIGTAVYPCLAPGCAKTFHRLYALRAHQRSHTLADRPFRCAQCPASFVRNHDLKRHERLHDRKAWRCAGCGKVFSRRDAIKRHKDSRGRAGGGGDAVCAYAEIEEVEVEKDGDEEASRRAKLWSDIAANQAASTGHASGSGGAGAEDSQPEEGEVDPRIVAEAQTIVLQLHGLLQGYVARGLGSPPLSNQSHVQSSQATLASVIAHSQQHHYSMASPTHIGAQSNELTQRSAIQDTTPPAPPLPTSLSLSEEQTRMLEQAIAQAALVAQAQAEAEAALEEEDEEGSDNDEEY
ncbi:predicted protein [Postia placenta Mad-698-R]|uniref:C2H2-type domain-containing protein n=1 Tax=Postia placenta MAD-698-R-SB12 TaxID=670580 RepID=A0A1X6NEM4_9APHY|nr:hypothetical protein POSPLADRAFT_1042353 [Postia placenta MAD-698-R-SB12]EED79682.1 predicted protein [Postia placenta Mad-698-R]OSX67075.1 hypothetical protein POSPLADRAFT_1042353 [Postia placenta MAD-698-R-SB12]